MPRLPWELDVFTSINVVVDLVFISLGLYLSVSRTKSLLKSKQQVQNTSSSAPQVPSLWSRKRPEIVLFATITTSAWHLIRLLLVAILSINALRVENAQRVEDPVSFDDIDAIQDPEDPRLSILMRPPAIWGVMALPVLIVLSRMGIILLFAFSKKQSSYTVAEVAPEPASPSSPRNSKAGLGRKLSESTAPTVTSPLPSSPIWDFMRTIPRRIHGPNQNLYLIAFYMCIVYATIFVPFTYHIIWYFDTPRLEPVTTLYLAAVLKDALNVKGMTTKEKRQRGIVSFQRMVYVRWAAILVMAMGVAVDAGWRLAIDGSMIYILWKVEV